MSIFIFKKLLTAPPSQLTAANETIPTWIGAPLRPRTVSGPPESLKLEESQQIIPIYLFYKSFLPVANTFSIYGAKTNICRSSNLTRGVSRTAGPNWSDRQTNVFHYH